MPESQGLYKSSCCVEADGKQNQNSVYSWKVSQLARRQQQSSDNTWKESLTSIIKANLGYYLCAHAHISTRDENVLA